MALGRRKSLLVWTLRNIPRLCMLLWGFKDKGSAARGGEWGFGARRGVCGDGAQWAECWVYGVALGVKEGGWVVRGRRSPHPLTGVVERGWGRAQRGSQILGLNQRQHPKQP